MKIIIAGSRDIHDISLVELAFTNSGFENYYGDVEIVSGCADGIDSLAIEFQKIHGYKLSKFPAKWKDLTVPNAIIRYNKNGAYNLNAGFDRNLEMALYADALIAIHNGSGGTANMIKVAKKQHLLIYEMDIRNIVTETNKINDLF